MIIRILFCLTACITLCTACKKDKNEHLVHGVVMNKRTNQPIAGAELLLYIPELGANFPLKPHSTAVSNNNGEYTLAMPERLTAGFGLLEVKKDALLMASYPGGYMSPKFDTVYMEDASYLKLVVKVTRPTPATGLQFNCALFEKDLQLFSHFPLNEPLYFNQPRADTLLIPFSVTRHPTTRAFFYAQSAPPYISDSILVEKIITSAPYTTTQLTIEY